MPQVYTIFNAVTTPQKIRPLEHCLSLDVQTQKPHIMHQACNILIFFIFKILLLKFVQ